MIREPNFEFNHQFSQDQDTRWIEQLALDEISMEETGIVRFQQTDPQIILEKASIDLMENIKTLFEFYVSRFNEYRAKYNAGQAQIRVLKLSDTVNDFMLYRNSLRLVVARRSADTISIGFLTNSRSLRAARLGTELSEQKIHDVRGHLGPFGHITWKFQGENVHFPSLVKHYLTEFTQLSAH